MNVPNPRRAGGRQPGAPRATLPAVVAALAAAVAMALLVPLSGSALPAAAPVNTSPPTIGGSAVRGETLVGSTGTWTGTAPISFAFQWLRCDANGANCASISGATNTTYTLGNDDVGDRIRLQVTGSNAEGSATALSEPTAVVTTGGSPSNTAEPRITGNPVEGQTLTASTGTWSGNQPITFTFQWVRCGADGGLPDGSNCAVIAGATRSTYVLQRADVNARLRVRVTGTNSAGSATAASNPTAVIRVGRAPTNTARPSVTGSWVENTVATVNRGTWSGASTFTYQWLRCDTGGGNCVAIPGATGTQYRVTQSDVGRKIRVDVTARNAAGSTTVRSTESATVRAAGPAGVIVLPSGERSIPVTSVPQTERLIVDRFRFIPSVVRSRTSPFTLQVRVKDTRGFVVRGAIVFARSTPLVTRAIQPRQPTGTDGWVTFQMNPRTSFPTERATAVQFFIKAYRTGDPPLAGVAGYRLVQVVVRR